MKGNDIEKNILDLQHSVNLAKAGTFLALAFSSWIAVFFGMKEFYSDIKYSILIATFVAIFFLYNAFKHFRNCEDIHNKIKRVI